ncbi:MAG: hypothetical protein II477_07255, partial [Lachnospiraceae bacterium]|nr:hypothetical protein [Lachnospiraceae bacterium]
MKKFFRFFLYCLLFILLLPHSTALAKELTPSKSGSGNTITVTAKDGTPIGAIYVKWNKPVSPYKLLVDGDELTCGEFGFLHEFIALDNPSGSVTFSLPVGANFGIYEIRIFSDNDVPSDVQIWEPVCERPDILLV